jgi:hypothetical protein
MELNSSCSSGLGSGVSKSGNGKHLKESEEREFREKVLTMLSVLEHRSTRLLEGVQLIVDRVDAMDSINIDMS